QRSSTEVRLSAFGQLRSSVAQLQESAAALANGANGANNANAANATNSGNSGNGANTANAVNAADASRSAATRFVNAFNQARSTANQVTQGSSGALAGDGRAAIAASQLSRTLSDDSRQQLRSIGINANQDGTLSIDQQRFNQALQDNAQGVGNALARVGTQVQQSTTRQLDDNGAINRSIDTLSARASQLQTQQAAQQQLAQQFQQQDRSQQQQDNANQFSAVNAINASGIAAYQKIFSL
ncbi:MAG TPA: flagellar filament capping protein FliD, partial [Rhodocyclaceae bacterium]|nr:flagellar filament capping protein FliD [Rhodocyclaceae bacterium]